MTWEPSTRLPLEQETDVVFLRCEYRRAWDCNDTEWMRRAAERLDVLGARPAWMSRRHFEAGMRKAARGIIHK